METQFALYDLSASNKQCVNLWKASDLTLTEQRLFQVNYQKQSDLCRQSVLSKECLKAILSAPGNSRHEIRDTTIMVVLYDLAVRLGELLSLKVSAVNLQRNTPYLRIHCKGDKERIVSISDDSAKHLERYIKLYHGTDTPYTEYLFYTVIHSQVNAMSPGNVERMINKYADKIRPEHPDLPEKVYPHMFRRTRATNLYQSDVELQLISRILGHVSTQTTRIYAKPSLEMIKSAMDRSNPELNAEQLLWPDDEAELARILGLR